MSSISSCDSRKRTRAFESRVNQNCNNSQTGNTLSVACDNPSCHLERQSRKRSHFPSRSKSASRSRSRSPKRAHVGKQAEETTANVCMVKRSEAREICNWMRNGIESKQECLTLLPYAACPAIARHNHVRKKKAT